MADRETLEKLRAPNGPVQLQDAQVETRHLRDASVTGTKLKDSSVTEAKLAFSVATQAELDSHLNDTADAHDASAISYLTGPGLSATDVEAALDELATEKSDTTHTHSTSLLEKTYSAGDASITGTGDDQAGVSLSSTTGISGVYFEILIEFVSGTNTQIQVEAEVHDPSHNVLETFSFRLPALGAGTIARNTMTIFAKDTTPGTGSYHISVTTFAASGGSVTVKQARLVGVAS